MAKSTDTGTQSSSGLAVEARALRRVYGSGTGSVVAVDDVDVAIAAGSMVCIMGKSGSGKSSLLRQLGLLDHPTSGEVFIEGEATTGLSARERAELRLTRLGYVFQEFALLAELTAAENVFLPALMNGMSESQCRARASELLEMVALSDRIDHRPQEMSGGEQQRVAIARALVNTPRILFADEPTGNLDTASSALVMDALAGINADLGVTVVFVSHDPDHRAYATDLVILRDGARVEAGL